MCNSCHIGEVVQSVDHGPSVFAYYLDHMLEKVEKPQPNAVIIAHCIK